MKEVDKATIGNRIRYERQKAGLTLEELGNKVGVSKQCLSGWEHGRNMPDVISLDIMSKVFNIVIEDFLYDTSSPENKKHPTKNTITNIALTEKELQLINKLRTLSAERRKAVEILFGIRDKK